MNTFVIGDIHGAHKALMQCLKGSEFNYAEDTLIVLGDVCDGWNEVPQCIEELLKIKNLVYVWGNHDWWANAWLKDGLEEIIWVTQGGQATKNAYLSQPEYIVKHRHFFDVAKPYYLIHDNDSTKLFVHGGIPPSIIMKPIEKQDIQSLMWDRELLRQARLKHYRKPDFKWGGYDEIFIGHTATHGVKNDEPLKYCNVWCLDQGAGWDGKLTIMNVDTHKYWQSDNVLRLYPNVRGRADSLQYYY